MAATREVVPKEDPFATSGKQTGAFLLFSQENRKERTFEIVESFAKSAGVAWRAIPAEEKAEYIYRAKCHNATLPPEAKKRKPRKKAEGGKKTTKRRKKAADSDEEEEEEEEEKVKPKKKATKKKATKKKASASAGGGDGAPVKPRRRKAASKSEEPRVTAEDAFRRDVYADEDMKDKSHEERLAAIKEEWESLSKSEVKKWEKYAEDLNAYMAKKNASMPTAMTETAESKPSTVSAAVDEEEVEDVEAATPASEVSVDE